jgi:hypothetical protein
MDFSPFALMDAFTEMNQDLSTIPVNQISGHSTL